MKTTLCVLSPRPTQASGYQAYRVLGFRGLRVLGFSGLRVLRVLGFQRF